MTGAPKKETSPQEVLSKIKDKKQELDKSLENMSMPNLELSLKLTESLLNLAPSSHATLAR